jgi:predicted thioesterase
MGFAQKINLSASLSISGFRRRFVKFSVGAHDGVAQIGTGTHVRALVELSRFNKNLGEARQ